MDEYRRVEEATEKKLDLKMESMGMRMASLECAINQHRTKPTDLAEYHELRVERWVMREGLILWKRRDSKPACKAEGNTHEQTVRDYLEPLSAFMDEAIYDGHIGKAKALDEHERDVDKDMEELLLKCQNMVDIRNR